jgi:hypothetical protein
VISDLELAGLPQTGGFAADWAFTLLNESLDTYVQFGAVENGCKRGAVISKNGRVLPAGGICREHVL